MAGTNQSGRFAAWALILSLVGVGFWCLLLPNLVRARNNHNRNPCPPSLRAITAARPQCAQENILAVGATVGELEIAPYLRNGRMPACPQGGKYSINPIGVDLTCSIPEHKLLKTSSPP